MIPVIQHNGAQHSDPRLAENVLATHRQAPTSRSERVGHRTEVFFRGPHTLLKRYLDFAEILRLRRIEVGLRGVELVESAASASSAIPALRASA